MRVRFISIIAVPMYNGEIGPNPHTNSQEFLKKISIDTWLTSGIDRLYLSSGRQVHTANPGFNSTYRNGLTCINR